MRCALAGAAVALLVVACGNPAPSASDVLAPSLATPARTEGPTQSLDTPTASPSASVRPSPATPPPDLTAMGVRCATYGSNELGLPEHGWYRPFEAPGQGLFVARTTAETGWAMVALRAGERGWTLDPLVIYEERSINIAFAIRDLPGGHDCRGNPPYPYVLEMREPLGDRTLLDASKVPPSPPLGP